MSISSNVGETKEKIRAIPDPDNTIEWAKDSAIDAADDVMSDGRKIQGLAWEAKTNDGEILSTAQAAERALKSFISAARTDLETQMKIARDAMDTAQRNFDQAATRIVTDFEGSIRAINDTKSENDGVHDEIIETAW